MQNLEPDDLSRNARFLSGSACFLNLAFLLGALRLGVVQSLIYATKSAAPQDLTQRQLADVQRLAPDKALNSWGMRALSLTANLYLTPPSFAEAANYHEETSAAEAAYIAMPGHAWGRSFVVGGIYLTVTVLGVGLALVRALKNHALQRRILVLMLAAAALQFAALVMAVPLPWQRYSIPLLPFVCLFTAYGLLPFIQKNITHNRS